MLIALYVLGFALGIICKKSKAVRAYQFFATWIVFAFNTNNADMEIYKEIFNGGYGDSHEIGFDIWRHLFADRGISFEVFWIVTVSIALLFLFKGFRYLFHGNYNIATSMLMIFPLLNMVITLRNTIAIAIVFVSIAWYLQCDTKRIYNKIIYSILVLLASSFHYASLFFFIVLVVKEELPSNKSLIRAFGIMICATIILNTPIFNIILSKMFHSNKVLDWFLSSNRIGFGIILVIGMHAIEFFIVIYTNKCHRYPLLIEDELTLSVEKKIYSINVYSMFLMGFYTFNMEFFTRIYCVVIILNCINSCHLARKYNREHHTAYGLIMQIIYIMFVFWVLYRGDNTKIIVDLFVYNKLF